MRKQRIISSSMTHIVCESNGRIYEFDIDIDEPFTPTVMRKLRRKLKDAVEGEIHVLNWQRYEQSD